MNRTVNGHRTDGGRTIRVFRSHSFTLRFPFMCRLPCVRIDLISPRHCSSYKLVYMYVCSNYRQLHLSARWVWGEPWRLYRSGMVSTLHALRNSAHGVKAYTCRRLLPKRLLALLLCLSRKVLPCILGEGELSVSTFRLQRKWTRSGAGDGGGDVWHRDRAEVLPWQDHSHRFVIRVQVHVVPVCNCLDDLKP